MGRKIAFRPATFYLGIADMLAEEVEGQPAAGSADVESRAEHVGEGNKAGQGATLAVPSKASTSEGSSRTSDEVSPSRES